LFYFVLFISLKHIFDWSKNKKKKKKKKKKKNNKNK